VLRLFAIFITLLGPFPDALQPSHLYVSYQANSISGHVSDDRGKAVPDVYVELLNDVEAMLQRTKTDGSGRFVFQGLSVGIFQIKVQADGTSFIGQTKRVQLERTRAFEQVDFVLGTKRTITSTTGVVFVQQVPELARKEYESGVALLQKAERREGIDRLKKAIEFFPLYYDALELLGTEYVKLNEFELAIPVLTKAIEVNVRAYHSLNALSVAQYNLKQIPQAIESVRRAVALNQKSASANLWLGTLLRQTNKLDEAETYLKQADQLAASKSADTHWQLALLYNQLKRYKEAADELELFLKVQPDSRDVAQIKKLIERLRQQSGGGVKP
jgi:tetratricopeptide (TPR) repeat protein